MWTSLLAAISLAAATAEAAGSVSAKGGPAPRLLDSSDPVHILSVVRTEVDDEVTVLLRIDEGYHINANPASEPYLIPTTLAFKDTKPLRIVYPAATSFKPKFVDEALDVYQGTVAIRAFLPKGTLAGTPMLRGTLTVQACTDVVCLPPADLPLLIHS